MTKYIDKRALEMYDLTIRENDVGKLFPRFLHQKASAPWKRKVMEEEKT